jgi:hypothetical protein
MDVDHLVCFSVLQRAAVVCCVANRNECGRTGHNKATRVRCFKSQISIGKLQRGFIIAMPKVTLSHQHGKFVHGATRWDADLLIP